MNTFGDFTEKNSDKPKPEPIQQTMFSGFGKMKTDKKVVGNAKRQNCKM